MMKKLLIIILTILMIISSAVILPINAANDSGSILYNADFKDIYTTNNYSGDVDSSTVTGLGVKPLSYRYADGTIGVGDCYNKLTSNGLAISAAYRWTAGFALTNDIFDLTKKSDYCIQVKMLTNVDHYIYFGFGYDSSNTTYNPMAYSTNARFNNNSAITINNFFESSSYDANNLYNEVIKNNNVSTYTFIVKNNSCKNIIISCNGAEATYTSSAGLDAYAGNFAITLRPGVDGDSPAAVIKSVAVIDGTHFDGETLGNVNFTNLYENLLYSQNTPFDTLLNTNTGFTPINYQFSEGDLGEGKCNYDLTSEGLDIDNVYRRYAGIVLSTDSYKDLDDYYLTFTMDTSYEHYLYFGWGYKTLRTDNTYDAIASGEYANFRHDGANTNNQVAINNWFKSSGSPADIYATEVTLGKTAEYTFIVKDGLCKEVRVTCGGAFAVYTNSTGLNAKNGYFGLFVRTASKVKESGILIKNIRISYGNYVDKQIDNLRQVPNEVDKVYQDTETTKYVPGYVLHYMDFSKATSFEETGYFFTNDSTPARAEIEDGLLKVTTYGGAYMLFTANAIPKNIQNYTVEVKFKFTDANSSYLTFLQSVGLNETSFVSANNNTCIRYNGTVDNCTALDEEIWASVTEAYKTGETITFTYSAAERYVDRIVISCGDKTATLSKTEHTYATPDSYMGLMFGFGSSIDISSIKITAGSLTEIEDKGYTWPAEENSLVRNVSIDAIDTTIPDDITTPNETTSPIETSPQTTGAASTTNTPAMTPPIDDEDDGNKIVIIISIIVIIGLAGGIALFMIIKKK